MTSVFAMQNTINLRPTKRSLIQEKTAIRLLKFTKNKFEGYFAVFSSYGIVLVIQFPWMENV